MQNGILEVHGGQGKHIWNLNAQNHYRKKGIRQRPEAVGLGPVGLGYPNDSRQIRCRHADVRVGLDVVGVGYVNVLEMPSA
jgi:hypothetical protein